MPYRAYVSIEAPKVRAPKNLSVAHREYFLVHPAGKRADHSAQIERMTAKFPNPGLALWRRLGACLGLLCALRVNHRRQCCDQNIQVEPKGAVLDIETVLRALHVEVAIAA